MDIRNTLKECINSTGNTDVAGASAVRELNKKVDEIVPPMPERTRKIISFDTNTTSIAAGEHDWIDTYKSIGDMGGLTEIDKIISISFFPNEQMYDCLYSIGKIEYNDEDEEWTINFHCRNYSSHTKTFNLKVIIEFFEN